MEGVVGVVIERVDCVAECVGWVEWVEVAESILRGHEGVG
jgi:hypothetical protein